MFSFSLLIFCLSFWRSDATNRYYNSHISYGLGDTMIQNFPAPLSALIQLTLRSFHSSMYYPFVHSRRWKKRGANLPKHTEWLCTVWCHSVTSSISVGTAI
ncbi:hypothetical protein RvY_08205 [Ramazzottius varieornatus]|uniref:Secreted protein n=1 Tax=Ramazzottius varieornatus TaxID=947166 RepID=A0A1D1V7D8_RAMVA|nr:hypothetical protein RvY_08205 [Ramazzottius varieornatus]